MKLRFRQNSLRLRVNRREVEGLSNGLALNERVDFPGDAQLGYVLETAPLGSPAVEFKAGIIRVTVPCESIREWATTDAIGIYFNLPAKGSLLQVAIEKDLECVDAPSEERDPHAYVRSGKNC
jgi:hypothetical protein